MADDQSRPLVAVDIGNTRVKLGLFDRPLARTLPEPKSILALPHAWPDDALAGWLPGDVSSYAWCLASVHRAESTRLLDWLTARKADAVQMLDDRDLDLKVELARPDHVGIDRLVDAVAVNRLRTRGVPAIVVDFGSAPTIDVVSASGAFIGGAILPGISMSARALHEFTDLLPLIEVTGPPEPLGKSTIAAMNSGLFWGAVGAVREVIHQLSADMPKFEIFVTGGTAPGLVEALACDDLPTPRSEPHLTLAGIAISALQRPIDRDAR